MMMEGTGENGVIRGSFTPETNLAEYSIELERECKNFILQKNTTNLGYTSCIEFSGRTVTVKGHSHSAPGYLVPEQYNYIAW